MSGPGTALIFVIDNLERDRPSPIRNIKHIPPVGETLQVSGRIAHQGFYGSPRQEIGKFRTQELTQVRGQTFFTLGGAQLFFFLLFLLPTTFGLDMFGL